MQWAVSVPNFAEPADLVDLGVAAEAAGWDGVFYWDHLYAGPAAPLPVADPWIVLGALAARTSRIRLGPMVTPLPRRRPQKVAREAVTLDRLAGGRLVLGVGLGNPMEEFSAFGDDAARPVLGDRLDEALDVVTGLWRGTPFDYEGRHYTVRAAQFLPAAAIPVWVAGTTPHRRPLRRAARFDGLVLATVTPERGIDPVTPDLLSAAVEEVRRRRGRLAGFDVAVLCPAVPTSEEVAAYAGSGATWLMVTGWLDGLPGLIAGGPPV
ncbi:MAG TPA: LLM class flavin-dependent oxidoreductase [Acidimicrobiales bacterium]|nr:LLM class flavin-dependent oxidoreductase [Acidimicrobiales bacterium]